jgi:hypothetical protein
VKAASQFLLNEAPIVIIERHGWPGRDESTLPYRWT